MAGTPKSSPSRPSGSGVPIQQDSGSAAAPGSASLSPSVGKAPGDLSLTVGETTSPPGIYGIGSLHTPSKPQPDPNAAVQDDSIEDLVRRFLNPNEYAVSSDGTVRLDTARATGILGIEHPEYVESLNRMVLRDDSEL
ncbi:hypothetical protein K469DRAFT_688189 [Zopfia rhizophila CBS 207.26]|uniref:Uncharacterized protein n=1 Tax=Zopfia rhizophila CBS 207.26 TaxID=1314779 RepID=A0A6A6DZ57_9PEZI|nr:hypothetical protein K469DRAFT_688189 [Zopfia rhizophila CBS 207.26]